MNDMNEKAPVEAATPSQGKAEPLYENSTITALVMQVLERSVEAIRILGEGERQISVMYSSSRLSVTEWKVTEDYKHDLAREIVSVWMHKKPELVCDLMDAINNMNDFLSEIKKGDK